MRLKPFLGKKEIARRIDALLYCCELVCAEKKWMYVFRLLKCLIHCQLFVNNEQIMDGIFCLFIIFTIFLMMANERVLTACGTVLFERLLCKCCA